MNSKYYDINSPGYSIKTKAYYNGDFRSISRVILCLHGFGGHKDNKAFERFAEFVMSKYKKCAVICFDLPAHGSDVRKKLRLEDCDTYISLILDDIKLRFHTDEIYAYATSFGGYLVLKYVHDHDNPFARIALRCPAIHMYKVIYNSIVSSSAAAALAAGKDAALGFDRLVTVTPSFINELKSNDLNTFDFIDWADSIYICHGTKDEIVPISDSIEFCDNNVIEFTAIENADHRFQDRVLMDLAINIMAKFLLQ